MPDLENSNPVQSAPAPAKPEAPAKEPEKKSSSSLWWKAGCALIGIGGVLSVAALVVVGIIFGFAAVANSSFSEIESLGSRSVDKDFTEEYVSGSRFASSKILVIDVSGVITSAESSSMHEIASSKEICEQLKSAEEDSAVKAIIINLDTPGGEVTAADEIYHEILKVRAKPYSKPVVAMMNSLAASGGYYVAVGCDSIVANKMTLTGSIGVIIEGYNYSELFKKIGLSAEVYKSGEMKDMLNGARERTPAERALVQELVNSTYNEFLKVVSNGRKIPLEQLRGTHLVDGRVLSAQQALDAKVFDKATKSEVSVKLIDKIGYFEDAKDEAASLAKISNYKVVRYSEAFSFAKIFEKMSAKDTRAVKIDIGGIESKTPLKQGCLYFLPSTL